MRIFFDVLTLEIDLVGVRQARAVVQRLGDARGPQWQATVVDPPPQKINLISKWAQIVHMPDNSIIN